MKTLSDSDFRHAAGRDPEPRTYYTRVQNVIEWANEYHAEELGRPIVHLDDVRELAARKIIYPSEIFRFRGMGHKNVPGKLALYLFPELKSRDEQKLDKAILFAGDGI